MLNEEEYSIQLHRLYNDVVKSWPACRNANICESDASLTLQIDSAHAISASLRTTRLSYVEVKVIYSKIYREPLLLFRIWDFEEDNDIPSYTLVFPKDIDSIVNKSADNCNSMTQFSVSLDIFNGEVWFNIHPCDTTDIVGDDNDFKNDYLNRWFSVFALSWLN
ncbi:hypothetical protein KAFR_0L00220 [Kazachstania africana CBS 2517]|uniref:Uncharacterized protein n=1 Tax=Kazachstania africana (strain ATCC 22294 / BCRC 22015 / CBS 2517 / CECT 1963 / NBRC 1671 / NRRL Y-8276) TaxID=1071382 RepID=H2B1X9_KAZAF|nr:hypothetical protein KAFR_0L00220 [Kazachstania africana CBS 2517]CCF60629.1 hypothetical protein KAFR_0L00220 [Kazachstania africana CBS 2517]